MIRLWQEGGTDGFGIQHILPLPLRVFEGSIYSAAEGICTGHKDKTKLPVRCSYLLAFRYTTISLGNTVLLLLEFTGCQLPGLVPKMPEGPVTAVPCVKMSKATTTEHCPQGLLQPVLATRCYSGGHILASVPPWFVLAGVQQRHQSVLACLPGSIACSMASHSNAVTLSIADTPYP